MLFRSKSPKVVYPELVREFYANLTDDGFKNCVSRVRGKRIILNPPSLSVIIGFDNESMVDVYTAKGFKSLSDFSTEDQLKAILGSDSVSKATPPNTKQVLPLANLLFRFSVANICPRTGNHASFNCQDVLIVAMLMSGKSFDLPSLLLNSMRNVVEQSKSDIPYGLLLTRIFEYFKIDVSGATKTVIKDFYDNKSLAAANLKAENGSVDYISVPTPTKPLFSPDASPSGSADPFPMSVLVTMVKILQADQSMVLSKLYELGAALDVLTAEVQGLKGMVLSSQPVKESATHSHLDDDVGLANLADVAAADRAHQDADSSPHSPTPKDADDVP